MPRCSRRAHYLFDFFIIAIGDALSVGAEASRLAGLQQRLLDLKLRAKVALGDAARGSRSRPLRGDGTRRALGLDDPGAAKEFAGGVAYIDPRLDALGARFLFPRENIDAPKQPASRQAMPKRIL